MINNTLLKNKPKNCVTCGSPLSDSYRGFVCEKCRSKRAKNNKKVIR